MHEYLIFSYFDFYPGGGLRDLLTDRVSGVEEVLSELKKAIDEDYLDINVQIYDINRNHEECFIYDPIHYGYDSGDNIYKQKFLEAVKNRLSNNFDE